MVLTISPNKVSGPNNVIKKHMKIPTMQLLLTRARAHTHTHTHTNQNAKWANNSRDNYWPRDSRKNGKSIFVY